MNEESEIWKDVVGYEGLYKVSNLGNVYSYYTNKMLKQGSHWDGYRFVILYKNKNKKYMSVHRLVSNAFIPNPDNLPLVNHLDENPSNNRADNLEWCTALYNNTYSNVGSRASKTLSKKVYGYDNNGNLIFEYYGTREAERQLKELGVSSRGISNSCKKENYTSGGYVWSYTRLSKEQVINRFKLNNESKISIGEYAKKTKSKKVNQYDLDGNFICSYPSAMEASRQLGFSPSLIMGVCRGEHKHTHGFVFKYA